MQPHALIPLVYTFKGKGPSMVEIFKGKVSFGDKKPPNVQCLRPIVAEVVCYTVVLLHFCDF